MGGGGGLNRKIYRRFSLVYPITTDSWMAPQEYYTEVNNPDMVEPWVKDENDHYQSYYTNVLTKNNYLCGPGVPIKVNVNNPYDYDTNNEIINPMDYKYPYWINVSSTNGAQETYWYVENGYVEVIDDRYVIKHDGKGVYKNFLNGCRFERMLIDFNNDFVDAAGYFPIKNENRGKDSGIREFINVCKRMGQAINFPQSNYNYVWNYDLAKYEPYRKQEVFVAEQSCVNSIYNDLLNKNHTIKDVHMYDVTKWKPGSLILSYTALTYGCIISNSFCDWIGLTNANSVLSDAYRKNNDFSFTDTLPKLYYEKMLDKRKTAQLSFPLWNGPGIRNTSSNKDYSTYDKITTTEPSIHCGPYFFINDKWNPDKIGGGGIGTSLIDENELNKIEYNLRLIRFNNVLYNIVTNSDTQKYFSARYTDYNKEDLDIYNKIINHIYITNEDIRNVPYHVENNIVDDIFDAIGYLRKENDNVSAPYHYGFVKNFSWHPDNLSDIDRSSIVFYDDYVC